MFLVNTTRDEIIKCLPKDGIVAEIGVDRGEFSSSILMNNKPNELYLIDPWRKFEPFSDYPTGNIEDLPLDDNRFFHVCNMFKNINTVTIFRGTSKDAVKQFPEQYFDWVFIDGDHTKKGVLNDLNLYSTRVRNDGFIICHDYVNYDNVLYYKDGTSKTGVVEAVNDFCKESGYQILLITLTEMESSICVLTKNYSSNADNFLLNVIGSIGNIIEIDDISKFVFKQKQIGINGYLRFVHKFEVR